MRSIPAGGKRAVTSLDHHREHLHQLTWQRRQPGAGLSCRLVRTNAAAKSTGQGPRPGFRHSAGRNLEPPGISALEAAYKCAPPWERLTAPHGVIPGYTDRVKTAISVPDQTFEQATRQAAELGISRSEFFARAARRYLDELASRSLTQQVDEALQAAGRDDSAAAAAAAGRQRLAAGDDW
jgi:hypothetical protein